MFQTRMDYFLSENRSNFKKTPINLKSSFIDPWIKIYAERNIYQLKEELMGLERKFKRIDLSSLSLKDKEYLRALIITLNVINEILEKTLKLKEFNFAWQDILQYITSESKNPSFMLSSMIREIKRRISFRLNFFLKKKVPTSNENMFRQSYIDTYLE